MPLQIKPAEKFKQYARVCLWGTPKAGKSHTALALATALAGEDGQVGVISSEFGSTKLLAHKFPHEIIDLSEADENNGVPVKDAFSPQRYEQALKMFVEAGYKAIVIDSLSHAWAGSGGLLEAVGKHKNTFSDGWGENSPVYDRLVNSILAARCHIIVTLRAKDKYVQEEYIKRNGEKGTMPKNAGEAPVIRKGFGFEMQLTIRMDSLTGYVEASAVEDYIHKGEEIEKPDAALAYRLLEALDGVPLPEPTEQQIEMRQLLDEFYNLSPATYARIPNWEQMALSKALDTPAGQLPAPQDYTEDDVQRMRLYVASKRQSKAS
jgi:hypothetical protein